MPAMCDSLPSIPTFCEDAQRDDTPPLTKLWVGGFSSDLAEDEVRDALAQRAQIKNFTLLRDAAENSRGFGYVTFEAADDAESALKSLDGIAIGGKPLQVSLELGKKLSWTHSDEYCVINPDGSHSTETMTYGYAFPSAQVMNFRPVPFVYVLRPQMVPQSPSFAEPADVINDNLQSTSSSSSSQPSVASVSNRFFGYYDDVPPKMPAMNVPMYPGFLTLNGTNGASFMPFDYRYMPVSMPPNAALMRASPTMINNAEFRAMMPLETLKKA